MTSAVSLKHPAVTLLLILALRPLAVQAVAATGTRYPHVDHLGSIVAISDVAGNVTMRNRYRPWGEALAIGDEAGAIRFTGKGRDETSGQYYFGARYLDPGLGRFLSADPARQIRSPYAYAGDAPLVNVDPDGRVFSGEELRFLESRWNAPITLSSMVDLLRLRAKRLIGAKRPKMHELFQILGKARVRENESELLKAVASHSGEFDLLVQGVRVDLSGLAYDIDDAIIAHERKFENLNRVIGKSAKRMYEMEDPTFGQKSGLTAEAHQECLQFEREMAIAYCSEHKRIYQKMRDLTAKHEAATKARDMLTKYLDHEKSFSTDSDFSSSASWDWSSSDGEPWRPGQQGKRGLRSTFSIGRHRGSFSIGIHRGR